MSICKKMRLEHFFTPYTKENSCVKNLNVILATSKILGKNIGQKLFGLNLGNECLDSLPDQKPQTVKVKTKTKLKTSQITLKSFFTANETINKVKRQPMDRRYLQVNI